MCVIQAFPCWEKPGFMISGYPGFIMLSVPRFFNVGGTQENRSTYTCMCTNALQVELREFMIL